MDADLKYLRDMLRQGVVMEVDREKRRVRVKFPDTEVLSWWLPVLTSAMEVQDGETGPASGGSGEAEFAEHRHGVTLIPWLPRVNDRVLCIYIPVFNGDGFVLGGLP